MENEPATHRSTLSLAFCSWGNRQAWRVKMLSRCIKLHKCITLVECIELVAYTSHGKTVLGGTKVKTTDYIDAVKAAYSLTSDYQLAKKLGENTSRISTYRTGTCVMNDEMAIKIAYLLDLNPLAVLSDAHIEYETKRGNDSLVMFWQEVRKSGQMDTKVLSKMVA